METTRLSTKGQIVIPERVRHGIREGTVFVVSRQDDLIVLKKVDDLTMEEKEELRQLDRIWKDIDAGRCSTYTEKEFFAKFKAW